jgi:transposase
MSRMGSTKARRRARRQFSDEFKAGAVRLVVEEGKTVGAVARELDLTPSALGGWVERAQAERTKGKSGLMKEERDELARLRKEVRILAEERDILKNHPVRLSPHYLLDQKLSVRLRCDHPGGSGRLLFGDAVANP